MKTTFSKLRKNAWFKKPTTGDQIFIKGAKNGKDYCGIMNVYGGGRKVDEDFEVIKVDKKKFGIIAAAKILLVMVFLSGCGTYHHHDNDRCLNDSRIRHEKSHK